MNETPSTFPIQKYLQVIAELNAAKKELAKEKATWTRVRNTLSDAQINELDTQFADVFEILGSYSYNKTREELQAVYAKLAPLVQQGASAHLLGNYELGSHNLAMLIEELNDYALENLDLVLAIIRLTIVADANLATQKAYIGNGGAISLEWVCAHIARGTGDYSWLKSTHYEASYTIFCWIFDKDAKAERPPGIIFYNPFEDYLLNLRPSPDVVEWQERVILAMMSQGLQPIPPDPKESILFKRLATTPPEWLTLLFPYEDAQLKHYLLSLQSALTMQALISLMNAFTINTRNRKHFKAYFSIRPHWLLRYIISSMPDVVFQLVKRNEKELLAPFLKHFRSSLQALRDENGNTLLHHAISGSGVAVNTVQLLRDAGFSLDAVNKDGLTPAALAERLKKSELIRILK